MSGPSWTITEKAFQGLVEQAARANRWLVYHTYDSRRSEPGFPDLVMVHPERELTLFVELKREGGKPSEHQERWLAALQAAGQTALLWTPSMWDQDIEPLLTGREGGSR